MYLSCFFLIIFYLVCFSYQFGEMFDILVKFLPFMRCFEKIFNIWYCYFFFIETILMTQSYSTPTWILIPFSNLRLIFQKIVITYNLNQTVVQNRKFIFQRKIPTPFKLMLFATFRPLARKRDHIQYWSIS